MKQRTLEEVKEYFKNAKEVRCLFDKKVYDITNAEIISDERGRFEALFEDGSYCRLQKYNTEYAEILTYKEKTFSITESQIKELVEKCPSSQCKEDYLKELFPEVFKSEVKELKVGTWYKWIDGEKIVLWFLTKIENDIILGYGFLNNDWVDEKVLYSKNYYKEAYNELKEATEQEVFEALKNEAFKRGFVGDKYVDITSLGFVNNELITGGELEWKDGWLNFGDKKTAIFKNGVWGKVIDSITLSEAEQQLGKKIIV